MFKLLEDELLCYANKDLINDETDTSEEGTSLREISDMPWDMQGCCEDEDVKPEDIYFSFLDRYPRKPVALGKDHQVDIPDIFCSEVNGFKDSTYEKFMEIGVTENNSEIHRNDSFGNEKSYCDCTDQGSVRCVRQHVAEVRERTKNDIGQQKFADLGFNDMGERVALKWTVGEENLFNQVVFANPASLGKNFWNILPQFFPNKSRQDLVSYYFNVFMLRKRSEQNRYDPLNVDSDNDEWQVGDDGRVSMEEYEEDSMVESPIYNDEIVYSNDGHLEEEEDNYCDEQGDKKYTSYDFGGVTINNDVDDINSKSVSNQNIESAENASSHIVNRDFQQGSCTLHEAAQNSKAVCHNNGFPDIAVVKCNGAVETDKNADNAGAGCSADDPGTKLNAECRKDGGISQLTNPEYSDIYCEPKPWDLDYSSRTESVVDFLPTCNVIEEVFGNGTWDS